MSKFDSYDITSVVPARQLSAGEDPVDAGAPQRDFAAGLEARGPGAREEESEDGDEDDDENDDDSLDFELYGDGISRERLMRQMKSAAAADGKYGDFLLENYKYWSLDDLSNSLKDVLKGLDTELINLVNENYLHYINLDKSIDGSFDLSHDIKIDLNTYLKALNSVNAEIDQNKTQLRQFKQQRSTLTSLKYQCEHIVKLHELVECFDVTIRKFEQDAVAKDGKEHSKTICELTALYFAISRIFLNVKVTNELTTSLGKKMNGLKLEFQGLLNRHIKDLKSSAKNDDNQTELFEIFKIYQLLNSQTEFKQAIS